MFPVTVPTPAVARFCGAARREMRGGVGHARDKRPESTTRGPPQEVFRPDGAPDVVDPSVRPFPLRCCESRPGAAQRRALTPGDGTGRRRPAPTACRARLPG